MAGVSIMNAAAAAIADLNERREILSRIARTPLNPDKVYPQHIIAAIAEYNKLSGDYPAEKHQIAAKVIFEVEYIDRSRPNLFDMSQELPPGTSSDVPVGEI